MNFSINIIAVFLTGATWAEKLPNQKNFLQDLFGNLIPNHFWLKNAYFILRPTSQPTSPWYRFNLTDGKLDNIGDKLKPKNDKKTCIAECSRGVLNARCHFNIKDASVSYKGQMSYRKPVVATFQLYAWIIEFQFYDHRNPALLSSSIVKSLSNQARKHDIRECLITDFKLSAVTFPPFSEFNFEEFKKHPNLSEEVWDEFERKLYTEVRLIVMRTIKGTCIKKLHEKKVNADSACSHPGTATERAKKESSLETAFPGLFWF
uniref:Putative conserved secreted protein n=1 Tax=Rhipicephalus microplus TaxID=6941 RepID=A0A6M2CM53_RHIMP